MLSEENVSLDSVEKVISMDPTLTISVIGAANKALKAKDSSYVATTSSIEQAILRLGMVNTMGIVLLNSTLSTLPENLRFPLSEHSRLTAVISKNIAKKTKMDKDVAYTSGLVHDIGLILFFIFLKNNRMSLVVPNNRFQEKTIFGMTHGEVGYLYLTSSHFNQEICSIIKAHHDNVLDLSKNALVIRLADMLANLNGITLEKQDSEKDIDSVVQLLGLKQVEVIELLKNALEEIKK